MGVASLLLLEDTASQQILWFSEAKLQNSHIWQIFFFEKFLLLTSFCNSSSQDKAVHEGQCHSFICKKAYHFQWSPIVLSGKVLVNLHDIMFFGNTIFLSYLWMFLIQYF